MSALSRTIATWRMTDNNPDLVDGMNVRRPGGPSGRLAVAPLHITAASARTPVVRERAA